MVKIKKVPSEKILTHIFSHTINRILLGVMLIMVLIMPGCINSPTDKPNIDNTSVGWHTNYTANSSLPGKQNSTAGNYVEVIHFHATSQCYSCEMVGSLAEKTVNIYFKDELNSGMLVFAHVNFDLPKNKDLVEKYGVTGSSLWIGTYINGTFHKEQNTNVWYKINNEQDYLNYLNEVLEKRLEGDLS